MKLYAGTTEQFRADAQMHRIAEKLRTEYTAQIGHKPAPGEVHAWQNSLMALAMHLAHAGGAFILVAIALSLAGCARGDLPSATPSPSPTLAPSPTMAATPTATPNPSETAVELTFPSPTTGQAVYDLAAVLPDETEAELEQQIDEIEARSGAQVVLYLRYNPDATTDGNLHDARVLMDEWGIGDGLSAAGLVILVSFDDSGEHGIMSTFGDAEMLVFLSEDAQTVLREDVIIATFRSDGIPAGFLAGIDYVDEAIP